jgi:hypothetical protein
MKIKGNRYRFLILAVSITGPAGLGITQAVKAAPQTSSSSSEISTNPFSTYAPPSGPERSISNILAIAMEESQRDAVPAPTDVTVEKGTLRAAAMAVSPEASFPISPGGGQEAWLNSTVALVTMHGDFVLNNVPIPAGAPTPRGPVLDLIIDNHTGEVEERSLPVNPPNLQQLEAVSPELPKAVVASARGVIAGHVYLGGGPALGRGQKPRKVGAPHYRVVVTQATGSIATASVVAETTTKEDGSFAIRIKPGRYQVAGQFSSGQFCFARNVIVRSGKPTKMALECSAK